MLFEVGQFISCPPYGISMKITAISGGHVECFWLDAKQRSQTKIFHASLLKPFKRSGPMRVRF